MIYIAGDFLGNIQHPFSNATDNTFTMKKMFAYPVIVFVMMLVCSKGRGITATTYTGTWELTRSYFNGVVYNFTDHNKGNGNTLTFGSNGTLIKKVRIEDALYSEEYTYHFAEGKRCGYDEVTDTLLY